MTEQLQLDTDTPEPSEYFVALRKGGFDSEPVKTATVWTLDQVANVVEGYRSYAVQSHQVTWKEDRISVGSCQGLAPGGEMWEMSVTPAVTIDA